MSIEEAIQRVKATALAVKCLEDQDIAYQKQADAIYASWKVLRDNIVVAEKEAKEAGESLVNIIRDSE